jgi:hypothetical protein
MRSRTNPRLPLRLERLDDRITPSAFTVTSAADSGPGSLRQAILNANAHANSASGADVITFAIGTGPQTIAVKTGLPAVSDPAVIDATTQPGFAGKPLVTIDGALAGSANGLTISAGHSTVKGLAIGGFTAHSPAAAGILLISHGGDLIQGNYLGTDAAGTAAKPNYVGLFIAGGANGNTVGGNDAAEANLISGNTGWGVVIDSSGNVLQGNLIGTDASGLKALGNDTGVSVTGTVNAIGGIGAGVRNVISANRNGVDFFGADNNILVGNLIGLAADGTTGLGNANSGVYLTASLKNTIGGTDPGAGNTIGYNGAGVLLSDPVSAQTPSSGNSILGNVFTHNQSRALDLGGSNGKQPAPVITAVDVLATSGGGDALPLAIVTVKGTASGAANAKVRVEVFGSSTAGPGSTGEAGRWAGSAEVTLNASGQGTFTVTVPQATLGSNSQYFTATATDEATGNTSQLSAPATSAGPARPVTLSAAASKTQLKVYNPDGSVRFTLAPYGTFPGGMSVAVGDVTHDGVPDIITGAGPGGGPAVFVFDGVTGQRIISFYAYDPHFTGGVFVAAGDVNGDGYADLLTGAGAGGGPHVQVFSGKDGARLYSFYAYDAKFAGGVRVAAGDVNGDGKADVITAAGPGGSPHVKVYSGKTGQMLRQFFAFDQTFRAGTWIAAADLDGDGKAEVIAGMGGAGSQVRTFSGATGAVRDDFTAYSTNFPGGARVAAADVDGDGKPDIITGAGPGGTPHVRVWSVKGSTPSVISQFFAFDTTMSGGVVVA